MRKHLEVKVYLVIISSTGEGGFLVAEGFLREMGGGRVEREGTHQVEGWVRVCQQQQEDLRSKLEAYISDSSPKYTSDSTKRIDIYKTDRQYGGSGPVLGLHRRLFGGDTALAWAWARPHLGPPRQKKDGWSSGLFLYWGRRRRGMVFPRRRGRVCRISGGLLARLPLFRQCEDFQREMGVGEEERRGGLR